MDSFKKTYSLPNGWARLTLEDISLPIVRVNKDYQDPHETIAYIDIETIDNNNLKLKTPKSYIWAKIPSRAQQKIKANDILFANVRPYLKNIAFVPKEYEGQVASTAFCIIRPCLVNPKYVYYYVLQQSFIDSVNKQAKGTSYPAVTNRDIMKQHIVFPVLSEQNQIVAKIEELFSELDLIVNIFNELNHTIEIYWYSELKKYFGGGNIHEDKKEIISSFYYNELPKDWKILKLSEIFENPMDSITDGPFGSNLKSSDFLEEGIPVLKIQNIDRNKFVEKNISYISEQKYEELIKHQFNNGDIVLTKLGSPLGKACIIPKYYKTGVIVADLIRIKQTSNINMKFLMYSLNSPYMITQMKKLSKGTTRQRITLSNVRNLRLIFPSKNTQDLIVDNIEILNDELQSFKTTIQRTKLEVEVLKQKILNDAYTGKLISKTSSIKENINDYITSIKSQKNKYLQTYKEYQKVTQKAIKMNKNLGLIELLEIEGKPVLSHDLWQKSRYKDDIEEFYKELKKIENKIREYKEGYLSYIELTK